MNHNKNRGEYDAPLFRNVDWKSRRLRLVAKYGANCYGFSEVGR